LDHAGAMEKFRVYLGEQGLKSTAQREAIAQVFFTSEGHLSLNDLLERAKRVHESVGYATVYRTMKLLAESGLASVHDFSGGETRYEPHVEGEHHDHLLCTRCGTIVEFEDPEIERLQSAVARSHGFVVTSHRHEIYGLCAACARAARG
jgi:Fur family transcriptional regulator, ferric uptake regulator